MLGALGGILWWWWRMHTRQSGSNYNLKYRLAWGVATLRFCSCLCSLVLGLWTEMWLCANKRNAFKKKNQACPNDRSDVAEVEAQTATFCGLQVRKVIPDVLFEAWMKRLECKYTTVKWRLPWATTKQWWQRQVGAFCTSSDYSFPPKLVSFVLFVFPVFILCYTWKKKSHNERLAGNNCR